MMKTVRKLYCYCFHKLYQPHKQFYSSSKNGTKWNSVIGLEIHAQLNTDSKLFSTSDTSFLSSVNSSVELFDAAIPGTLPVLNKKCVEHAVIVAKALSCDIHSVSYFDRKHYFYSDLPAGYQITQQHSPFGTNGCLNYFVFNPSKHAEPYIKSSCVKQIQLEQDSGKSLHNYNENISLIDLNRAGIPLIELVFEPDLNDGEEAAALINELTLIFERTGTCTCKMEEGALRVDANISVNRPGEPLGTRTEVKNIGSIRGVANAVTYEVGRQIRTLEGGGVIVNETRAWDAVGKKTVPLRDKEEKQDYRFMPEPNLPPLRLRLEESVECDDEFHLDVVKLVNNLPVLPQDDRKLLMYKFGLSKLNAYKLVNTSHLLNYFYDVMQGDSKREPKRVVDLLMYNLLAAFHNKNITIDEGCKRIKSSDIAESYDLLHSTRINHNILKYVLGEKLQGEVRSPSEIVKSKNLYQINDHDEIIKLCHQVMDRNQDIVKLYAKGKVKVFPVFVRDAVSLTEGRINSKLFDIQLKELLAK